MWAVGNCLTNAQSSQSGAAAATSQWRGVIEKPHPGKTCLKDLNLAKVGVVSSNLIARSNKINELSCYLGRSACCPGSV